MLVCEFETSSTIKSVGFKMWWQQPPTQKNKKNQRFRLTLVQALIAIFLHLVIQAVQDPAQWLFRIVAP
jgi:hypothetical protein